jgi:demethylmenaquinone methyltransferase/2-methoxy-6-polyprenyl-1,4-benzoquinol methylase
MMEPLLKPEEIIGIDISDGMLALGREKIKARQLDRVITLLNGDSETINYPDHSFDAVTVAFGVRNFQDLERGLSEIFRVLKPGGRLVVLEFSQPKGWFIQPLYQVYMNYITPVLGKLFSKNRNAYSYLDESIRKFPEGQAFADVLQKLGYRNLIVKPLSLGICSIYCGDK